MSAITLQFSTERSLGSLAIRLYSHGWASHVDTVLKDGDLLGARHAGGVAVRPPTYGEFSIAERVTLPTTDEIAKRYHEFIFVQIGKPYDSAAIAGFVVGRDWRSRDCWMCSELVAAGLEHAGFVHKLCTPAERVTPEMLRFLVSAFESDERARAASGPIMQAPGHLEGVTNRIANAI